jgi:hypothetical protein
VFAPPNNDVGFELSAGVIIKVGVADCDVAAGCDEGVEPKGPPAAVVAAPKRVPAEGDCAVALPKRVGVVETVLADFAPPKSPPLVLGVVDGVAFPNSGFAEGVVDPKSEGVVEEVDAGFPLHFQISH